MDACLLIRRVLALTLVVAVSIIGIPLPAQAAEEESPPPRVLTINGHLLSQLLNRTAPGDPLALAGLPEPVVTSRAPVYSYGLTLVGRQAGKTQQAAARITYAAVAASLAGMRDVACVGMAQDHRSAQRVLFGFVSRFFEQPLLRGLVTGRTRDTLTLRSGVKVLVLPCRPAAIRGLRCVAVALDEVCFFRASDNSALDREAWRASLATLLTTRGKLLAVSSPYGASGLAYDLHRAHWGHTESDVLVWQSPSYILHPGLDAAALVQIRAVDPEGARAEIDGEFLQGLSVFFDADALEACVSDGVRERPPETTKGTVVGAADPASGWTDSSQSSRCCPSMPRPGIGRPSAETSGRSSLGVRIQPVGATVSASISAETVSQKPM